jgi:hypothetical protein
MIDGRELREMLQRRRDDLGDANRRAEGHPACALSPRLQRGGGNARGLAMLAGAFASMKMIEAVPRPADRPKPNIGPNATSPVQRSHGEGLVFNGAKAVNG